jgi:nucleolar pre-ribosomal-associated protein 1
MGKRTASEATGKSATESPYVKRQRIERVNGTRDNASPPAAVAIEEVSSSRQLQKALIFERGTAEVFRNGMDMVYVPHMLLHCD